MNLSWEKSCADGTGLSSNSVNTEYWNNGDTEHKDTALVSATVTLLFIIIGIPSNLFIIISILWKKFYRQPTYILLLNLAMVDFFVCTLVMPFTVLSGLYGEFFFGNTDTARCRVCQFGLLFPLFGILSIHTRAFISLDRFLFIKMAIKYHQYATGKCYVIVCICFWVLISAITILPLFGIGDYEYLPTISTCTLKLDGRTKIAINMYYNTSLVLEMTIPIAILAVTNIWVICIIRRQIKKVYQSVEAPKTIGSKIRSRVKNLKHDKQLKLIKVFGAIALATVITSTPFVLVVLGTIVSGNEVFPDWFILIAFLSLISFPILHPIIEATLIPELKKVLIVLLSKLRCRKLASHPSFSFEVTQDSHNEHIQDRRPNGSNQHLKVDTLIVSEVSTELSSIKD